MSQTLGRATIKFNGKVIKSQAGAKLNPGGFERKIVKGDSIHGFSEEVAEPYIEGEYSVTRDTSVKEINEARDVTVIFETDIGRSWVLRNAWLEKPGDISAQEGGKVPFKFIGMTCEEM